MKKIDEVAEKMTNIVEECLGPFTPEERKEKILEARKILEKYIDNKETPDGN